MEKGDVDICWAVVVKRVPCRGQFSSDRINERLVRKCREELVEHGSLRISGGAWGTKSPRIILVEPEADDEHEYDRESGDRFLSRVFFPMPGLGADFSASTAGSLIRHQFRD